MRAEIRAATTADADAIAQVHYAAWNESYRGLLPDALIDARTFETRRRQWHGLLDGDDRITAVASTENGIVGFSSAVVLAPAVDGFCAYLQTLYLLSAAKRRGTGSALLRAVATPLLQRSCTNLALRVVRENLPARRFYERHGARLVLQGISVGGGLFDDVVYAYDDLDALVRALEPRAR